jgi:hypothetical protein
MLCHTFLSFNRYQHFPFFVLLRETDRFQFGHLDLLIGQKNGSTLLDTEFSGRHFASA